MNDCVLTASDLSFAYGRWRPQPVLTDFTWTVEPGTVTMLLGPNGAGKSTLLKLLAGLERPGSGTVSLGRRSDRRALHDHVGWMPQDVQPMRGLTVVEQLEYAAWVGGAHRRESRGLADLALRDVDLESLRDTRTNRLSGGQLRRLGLAQAIVRRPPVLLLDEPMVGLDPAQAARFKQLLRRLECPGGIVVSTHQIADLVDQVDRVVVLVEGHLQFDGTVDDLRRLGAGRPIAEVFTTMVGGSGH